MITPGKAATYVLLCPLSSASSVTPPKDILANFLPIDYAIDLTMDVLPTPGGPHKHKTLPLVFPPLNLTAKNSNILYLTFSNPV